MCATRATPCSRRCAGPAPVLQLALHRRERAREIADLVRAVVAGGTSGASPPRTAAPSPAARSAVAPSPSPAARRAPPRARGRRTPPPAASAGRRPAAPPGLVPVVAARRAPRVPPAGNGAATCASACPRRARGATRPVLGERARTSGKRSPRSMFGPAPGCARAVEHEHLARPVCRRAVDRAVRAAASRRGPARRRARGTPVGRSAPSGRATCGRPAEPAVQREQDEQRGHDDGQRRSPRRAPRRGGRGAQRFRSRRVQPVADPRTVTAAPALRRRPRASPRRWRT